MPKPSEPKSGLKVKAEAEIVAGLYTYALRAILDGLAQDKIEWPNEAMMYGSNVMALLSVAVGEVSGRKKFTKAEQDCMVECLRAFNKLRPDLFQERLDNLEKVHVQKK